ncbi:MAG: RecQ family ATP-dependent DNA helicase, partial [Prochlorococcaceae cyanobacterium]
DWTEQVGRLLEQLEQRDGVNQRDLGEVLAGEGGSPEERWRWLSRRLIQEDLISESDDGAQRLWLRPAGRSYLLQPWPLRWAA